MAQRSAHYSRCFHVAAPSTAPVPCGRSGGHLQRALRSSCGCWQQRYPRSALLGCALGSRFAVAFALALAGGSACAAVVAVSTAVLTK